MPFGMNLDDLKNMDDLKAVWDNLEERNWQGLLNAIRKVREEKGGNQTLDKLQATGEQSKSEGLPFPDSPGDLMKLVQSKT